MQKSSMRKIFNKEEKMMQDLSQELESYLNTLLTAPGIRSSKAVIDFLEIPPLPETLSFGATTAGSEAAQAVVEGSSALCVACGSFCRRLREILGSESVVTTDV